MATMRIDRFFLKQARVLPESIYIDLVRTLVGGRLPIVVSGLSVAGVIGVSFPQPGGPVVTALGGLVVLLLARRFQLVRLACRSGAATLASYDEARSWERRYAVNVIPYAAAIGAMNFVATAHGDSLTKLIVVAQIFGLCAGQVSRGSSRPRLCAAVVLLAAGPTAAGLIVAGLAAANSREVTVVLAVAGLILCYALASLETVAFNYRTVLAQLEGKRQMARLARVDPLTGLANRLSLGERLDAEVAIPRPGEVGFALHLIDLDGFKTVNDGWGHPVGDDLLREVARRLRSSLRPEDQAFRLGGDEFAIVQSGIGTRAEVDFLGRRIVRLLAQPYSLGTHRLVIGASDGTACFPGDARDLDQLQERADEALYAAKHAGKGQVSHWIAHAPRAQVA